MDLLTVEQASEMTGLSVETLNQWRSQGLHLPYVKLGKSVRYLRRDIETYINSHRKMPRNWRKE